MQGVKHATSHLRSQATENYQKELQDELQRLEQRKEQRLSSSLLSSNSNRVLANNDGPGSFVSTSTSTSSFVVPPPRSTTSSSCINMNNNTCNNTCNNTWVDSYQKWNEWQKEEELQCRIEDTQSKLDQLQVRVASSPPININTRTSREDDVHVHVQPSSMHTTSSATAAAGTANMMCCSSSQNRSGERTVAKKMNNEERLKCMISFRTNQGNRCYTIKKDYVSALKWYEKSLLYYEYCDFTTITEEEDMDTGTTTTTRMNVNVDDIQVSFNQERILCLVNCAACHLELKQYKSCIESCTEALGVVEAVRSSTMCTKNSIIDKNDKTNNIIHMMHIKALVRRAKAYRCLSQFDNAAYDLKMAKRHLLKYYANDDNQAKVKVKVKVKVNSDDDKDEEEGKEEGYYSDLLTKVLCKEMEALKKARDAHEYDIERIAKRMMGA